MRPPTYCFDQLTDLRSGPYAGQGGVFALGHDLGVHVNTLKSWRNGSREPNYQHRQAIAALWQEKCGVAR